MRADKYYVVDRVQEDVAVLMGDDGDEVAHPVYRLRCQVGEAAQAGSRWRRNHVTSHATSFARNSVPEA
jgi:hypothetical protein